MNKNPYQSPVAGQFNKSARRQRRPFIIASVFVLCLWCIGIIAGIVLLQPTFEDDGLIWIPWSGVSETFVNGRRAVSYDSFYLFEPTFIFTCLAIFVTISLCVANSFVFATQKIYSPKIPANES